MGLWDKLRQSRGPDSYFRYRLKRDSERKQAESERKSEQDASDSRREKADREHEYEGRYARELEGEIERERRDRSEQTDPDR